MKIACRCGRVYEWPRTDGHPVLACSECYRHVHEFIDEARTRYEELTRRGYTENPTWGVLEPPQASTVPPALGKPLSNNEIADLYDQHHPGRMARTQPLENVMVWAEKSSLFTVGADDCFYWSEKRMPGVDLGQDLADKVAIAQSVAECAAVGNEIEAAIMVSDEDKRALRVMVCQRLNELMPG